MKRPLLLLVAVVFLGGCFFPPPAPPPPEPTATFAITEWTQDYYDYSGEYSSYVYVYYKVTNTGTCNIDYYQVWIEVTCKDGSKYQEWTNGLDVAVGTYVTDYTMINTSKKKAVSVAVTTYELTSYSW